MIQYNNNLITASNNKSSQTHSGQNHCLIMDEVDGMAGNEDRGGMQVGIQLFLL